MKIAILHEGSGITEVYCMRPECRYNKIPFKTKPGHSGGPSHGICHDCLIDIYHENAGPEGIFSTKDVLDSLRLDNAINAERLRRLRLLDQSI